MKWKISSCHGLIGVELQLPSRQWQKSHSHQLGLYLKLTENIVFSFDRMDHTHFDHTNIYDHTKY